jgi:50S ribosomal subunit-associated GTPase HflX
MPQAQIKSRLLAKLKQNLDILLEEIQKNFQAKMVYLEIVIPHSRMDLVDLLYRQGHIEEIKYLQKGIKIRANLPKILAHNLLQNKTIEHIC